LKSKISGPKLSRKQTIEKMNTENPTGAIMETLDKDDAEEETAKKIELLVDLILNTPSFKLIKDLGSEMN
jgi:hypothetical protein